MDLFFLPIFEFVLNTNELCTDTVSIFATFAVKNGEKKIYDVYDSGLDHGFRS